MKYLTSWSVRYVHKLFEILMHIRFVFASPTTYACMYVCIWTHGFIFNSLDYVHNLKQQVATSTTFYLFCCTHCPIGGCEELLQLAPGFLWHTSFAASVIELWVFLLEKSIRNQDLGATYACSYWGFFSSRPFQLTQRENICVYANSCIY